MSSMLYLQMEPSFAPVFLWSGLWIPPEVIAVPQNGSSCVSGGVHITRDLLGMAARDRCGRRKDEGFIFSDERKLDPLPPLPHFRLIQRSS